MERGWGCRRPGSQRATAPPSAPLSPGPWLVSPSPGRQRHPPAQQLPGENPRGDPEEQRDVGQEAAGQRAPGAQEHQVGTPGRWGAADGGRAPTDPPLSSASSQHEASRLAQLPAQVQRRFLRGEGRGRGRSRHRGGPWVPVLIRVVFFRAPKGSVRRAEASAPAAWIFPPTAPCSLPTDPLLSVSPPPRTLSASPRLYGAAAGPLPTSTAPSPSSRCPPRSTPGVLAGWGLQGGPLASLG